MALTNDQEIKEQEDERSVATKMNRITKAGNKKKRGIKNIVSIRNT